MANIIDLLVAKSAEQQLSKLEKDLKKIHDQIIDINKQNITFASGASSQTINDLIAQTQAFDKAQRDQAQTLERLLRLQRSHNQTQMSANRLREQQASAADRAASRTERAARAAEREARRVRDASSAYMQLSRAEAEAARRLQDLIVRGVQAGQTQGQFNEELREARQEIERLRALLLRADNATGRWNRTNERAIVGVRGLYGSVRGLMAAFGFVGGITILANLAKDTFKLIKELQGLNEALKMVTGSEAEFAKQQIFLSETADKFGVDINTLTEQFTQFYVSAKDKLASNQIQAIFSSVTKAGAKMGLTVDAQKRAFLALNQMMSKGVISAEELRGQLGEALPGAFGIMAKAMNTNEKGLANMLKNGELLASEVLPKFAKALEKAYGIENVDRIETITSAQNRLSNEWVSLINNISDGQGVVSKFFITAINEATELLRIIKALNRDSNDFANEYVEAFNKYASTNTVDRVKEIDEEIKKNNKTLERQNQAYDDQKKKIDELNGSFMRFLDTNGSLREEQKTLEKIEKSRNTTILANTKLSDLRNNAIAERNKLEKEFIDLFTKRNKKVTEANALDYTKTKTDEQLRREIALMNAVVDENTKKTKKAAKAKKEEIKGLIGSEYWYGRQIAALREVRSKTAANTEAYAEITEQIKHYEEGLERLVNAQKKVIDPKFGTLEYYEKLKRSLEEQQKTLAATNPEWEHYERLIEAVQIDIDILTGKSKESTESLEEQAEAIKGYLEGFVEQFSSESGFGKTFDILRGKIEGFGTDAKVTALAVSEAFQEMYNTISNASNAHFQREYEALENQKEVSVLFAGDSAEAREEIEKTYEKRRKKIQREEAEAQKRLAVFNIAVNTAQAIVAALPNIPLSIAIGVIGAAQLAFAQSQAIPAFAEGGEMKKDGLMLVNDAKGSKYQETIETPDGQIIKPKGRNVLMRAKKGTKIYTPDQWDEKTASLATKSITKINYSAVNSNQGVTREDIKSILTNLATKENYHFSVDSNGVKAMIETNGKKAQIMNSVIKIKGKNV